MCKSLAFQQMKSNEVFGGIGMEGTNKKEKIITTSKQNSYQGFVSVSD